MVEVVRQGRLCALVPFLKHFWVWLGGHVTYQKNTQPVPVTLGALGRIRSPGIEWSGSERFCVFPSLGVESKCLEHLDDF